MVHVITKRKFGTGTLIGYFSVYVKLDTLDTKIILKIRYFMALVLEGSNGFLHRSLHRWSRGYKAIVKIVANTQLCCLLECL